MTDSDDVQPEAVTAGTRVFWISVATLAVPVAAQMILQSLLGMADVLMVGSLGSTAIAAVGLAAKLHFLLLVLMVGIGSGCSILVAQYSGARNFAACQRTLALALMLGAGLMLPFVLAFAFLSPLVLPLINPDLDVSRLAAEYLQITAVVLFSTQIIVVFEGALRARGNTGLPLLMASLAAALNVLLNYLLIFGQWGFPALGVAGAAWATLISRALQLVGLAGWLYCRKHGFALRSQHFKAALTVADMRYFAAFAAPLVLNHVVWGVGNATYHVLTGFAGTDALAVMGVVVPIESLFFSLFIGIANASTVLIGRALGASQHEAACRLQVFFDRLVIVLVMMLSIALWFSRPFVVAVFDELDEHTTELLTNTLAIFCVLTWVKVLNMLRILGVLRAGGDSRFCLVTDTIVMWGVGIPLYAVAVFYWHVPFLVIYMLTYVEDFAKFIPVRLRIGRRRWLNNLADGGAGTSSGASANGNSV